MAKRPRGPESCASEAVAARREWDAAAPRPMRSPAARYTHAGYKRGRKAIGLHLQARACDALTEVGVDANQQVQPHGKDSDPVLHFRLEPFVKRFNSV